MRTSRPSQHQLFAWDILVPYVVFVVVLSGVASYINVGFLMLASGFVMVYALGVLLTQWIVEVGGAKLKDDERIPLAFVSSTALIALIGSASFVLWPVRALFLARILLGIVGTLLCTTILLKRTKVPRLSTRTQVTMASVLAQPYRFTIALWLLLLIGLVIVLGASQESDECYTELFLANNETRLCSNAQASEDVWCIDIQVGIVNRESEPTEYILAFQTPAGASVLDPFTLEDGEMGEANIELPASTCEQEADVDIVLYRTSTPSPYRSIRLSCDFLSYHADD